MEIIDWKFRERCQQNLDIYPQSKHGSTLYVHKLVVRARQLVSAAQLVRTLHQNRSAAGLIPARGP